jgi:hypothetical protein
VKGTNGFTCMVERSWTAGADAPDFWNPKVRSPFCLNAEAVETYLPLTIMKTNLALAGKSKPDWSLRSKAPWTRRSFSLLGVARCAT